MNVQPPILAFIASFLMSALSLAETTKVTASVPQSQQVTCPKYSGHRVKHVVPVFQTRPG
jgi:hypothetical protein